MNHFGYGQKTLAWLCVVVMLFSMLPLSGFTLRSVDQSNVDDNILYEEIVEEEDNADEQVVEQLEESETFPEEIAADLVTTELESATELEPMAAESQNESELVEEETAVEPETKEDSIEEIPAEEPAEDLTLELAETAEEILEDGEGTKSVSYRAPIYVDANDVTKGITGMETKTCDSAIKVTSDTTTWGTADSETWYYVPGATNGKNTFTINGTITVVGQVNLILEDNSDLIVNGTSGSAGILVSGESNSLTIYGQSAGTGAIKATAYADSSNGVGGAGIGSAGINAFQYQTVVTNITINGGNVTATGYEWSNSRGSAGIGGGTHQSGANITINGGTVTAIGTCGSAGIGGGYAAPGNHITINGGEVIASSRSHGAGIGGGAGGNTNLAVAHAGTNIIINGGKVTATGGNIADSTGGGAGIGGGMEGIGSDITIRGGEVTATGGYWSAGIGGGRGASGSNITIQGGQVTANGGEAGDGIGSGANFTSSGITISEGYVFRAGTEVNPTQIITDTNSNGFADELSGKRYVIVTVAPDVAAVTIGETTTKYIDFAKAWTAAITADSASAIVLYADATDVAITVPAEKTVTIDLNGYALKGNGAESVITNNGTLTIQDTSEGKTGKITGGKAASGGGVYNAGTLALEGGNITANTATNGGGVYCKGTLTMIGGNITENTAENGAGVYKTHDSDTDTKEYCFTMSEGTIGSNTATSCGGGIYIDSDCGFTFTGGNITKNTAENGAGVYKTHDSDTDTKEYCFTMSKGTIGSNTATSCGGGIYIDSDCGFTFTDGSVTGNTAASGGGIYNKGTLDLNGGSLNNNKATASGGGIYTTGVLTLDGSSITYNEATTASGGGIYNSGTLTIKDGGITHNKATSFGGGVYSNGTITMEGGTVADNEATSDGGGIYTYGTLTQKGGSITGNKANYGGGVYVYLSTFTMNNGTISGNEANYGGGVDVFGQTAHFIMCGGSIKSNTANQRGGGVYTPYAIFTMKGGSITDNAANKGGGVYVGYIEETSAKPVTIGGTAKITGNKTGDTAENLYIDNTEVSSYRRTITIDDPKEGMSIGITTERDGKFTSNGTAADAEYFFCDTTDQDILVEDGYLARGTAEACIENAKYETITKAITAAGNKPTTITLLKEGLYNHSESVVIAENQNITLDLGTMTYTGAYGKSAIINNGTLTLTGTGGTVKGNSGNGVEQKGDLTLDGSVNIQGSNVANLYLCENHTVNIAEGFSGLVGLTMEKEGAFTDNGTLSYSERFTSDVSERGIFSVDTRLELRTIVATLTIGAGKSEPYYNLDTAWEMANDTSITTTEDSRAVIKLCSNVKIGKIGMLTVPAGRYITLDLNGKALTGSVIANNGNLILELNGGTLTGTGTGSVISNTESGSLTIQDSKGSTQGGRYKCSSNVTDSGSSCGVINNSGTFTMTGGKITGVGDGVTNTGSFTLTNGNINAKECGVTNAGTFTMTEGEITDSKYGVYNTADCVITGGEIQNNTYGVYLKSGTLTVGGTAYIAESTANVYLPKDSTILIGTGDTAEGNTGVAAPQSSMYVGVTMEAETGTFAASVNDTDAKYFFSDAEKYQVKYSDSKLVLVAKDQVAQIGETKYYTLQRAVEKASNGDTITLISDLEEFINIASGQTIILDLNGHTITGVLYEGMPYTIAIVNQGSLTLLDSAENGEIQAGVAVFNLGTFTMNNGSVKANYAGVFNYGTFTMNGGTISDVKDKMEDTQGSAVINEFGVFTMTGGAIQNSCIGIDNSSTCIMTGGEITDCDTDVYNEKNGKFIKSGGTVSDDKVTNAGNRASTALEIGVPNAQVIGLESAAAEIIPTDNSGKLTTVSLGVNIITEKTAGDDNIEAVGKSARKDGFLFLDVSLTKKVGDDSETLVSETTSVLEIIVPFDMTGKKYPVVYRVHDEATETFKEAGSAAADYGKDGTFYVEGSGANARIHFFTSKFSDYAIGYTNTTSNISGMSLTLDGTIGVNFYVDVEYTEYLGSDWKSTYPEAYVKLTYNNNTTSYSTNRATVTYKLSEQSADSTTGMYKFTCTATPAQMNDKITIQLYNGNGTDDSLVYTAETSIAAWCKGVITGSTEAEFVALCKSLLDYSITAQTVFSYNTGHLTNDGVFSSLTEDTAVDTNSITPFSKGTYTGEIQGLSFMALTESALRIYYGGDALTAVPTCSNSDFKVRLGTNSQGNYIEVYDIPAAELDTSFTLTIGDQTMTACGLSYAKLVLENYDSTENADTVKLCKALVLYNQAADAYFAN